MVAGENINAFQGVSIGVDGLAYRADAATIGQVGLFTGVAITSGLAGANIRVQFAGTVPNNGFLFSVGESVFVGLAGALVQNPNVGNYQQRIGIALAANLLELNIDLPIVR